MIGLLSPLKVKGLRFKNRLVLPPMQTSLATSKGEVTNKLIKYYVQRAKAVGLVIVEHSYVSIEGKLNEKQLGIHDDKLITGLNKLASQVHAVGAPIVIQINHAGYTTSQTITGFQSVAPSAKENARGLEIEELKELANKFVIAADRAMKAGFDGVEVHGAHGFLLNQFYSPLSNHRTDSYGGLLENRIRFPLEVVEKIKKAIDGRLLLYRLGSVDLDSGGVQLEDSIKFGIKLEELGVDIIDVSGGFCGSRPSQLQKIQGFFIPQAQHIKNAVNIPVIGVGGIRDPKYADHLVKEGIIDLVAIGRPILRDPEWVIQFIQQVKSMGL